MWSPQRGGLLCAGPAPGSIPAVATRLVWKADLRDIGELEVLEVGWGDSESSSSCV